MSGSGTLSGAVTPGVTVEVRVHWRCGDMDVSDQVLTVSARLTRICSRRRSW